MRPATVLQTQTLGTGGIVLQRVFQERMEGGNHVDPEIDADVFVRAETIDVLQLQ